MSVIPFFKDVQSFLKRIDAVGFAEDSPQKDVEAIIAMVRSGGDEALRDLTYRFDGVRLNSLKVEPALFNNSVLSPENRRILSEAAENIRAFHEEEKKQLYSWALRPPGRMIGQQLSPLRRVGVYVPGGTAIYPSSVLMNVIPAQVAGVPEIALVSPPYQQRETIHPLILEVANLLGIREIYMIGGAQAIAALAFGTESIRPVDKIVGPGNQYVAEAKRQVFGYVGIDSVAGPSEIFILADQHADPSWLAADLLSQAEHDSEARAILASPSNRILERTEAEVGRQLKDLPRETIAQNSLHKHGALVLLKDLKEGIQLIHHVAPEHLELHVSDPERLLPDIQNAGAIFLGGYTPEPVGDYWAGSNHVLPTARSARYASALSVRDFVRWSSVVRYDRKSLENVAEKIAWFARLEGLEAHARAVEIRLKARRQEK